MCHQELRSRSDEAFNLHIYDFNLELMSWTELLQPIGRPGPVMGRKNQHSCTDLVCIVAWKKIPGTRNPGLSKSRSFSGSVKFGLGSSLPLHDFLHDCALWIPTIPEGWSGHGEKHRKLINGASGRVHSCVDKSQ